MGRSVERWEVPWVGEAFRSGTHKAMIFTWLNDQGRGADKAEVYGYTRSWSKRGTAVGALVGAVIALLVGTFTAVFWFTLIPYAINLVNLERNILPTRERARLILEKGPDHRVERVRLRKI